MRHWRDGNQIDGKQLAIHVMKIASTMLQNGFKKMNVVFLRRLFQQYAVKRTIIAVNQKNRRWWENYTMRICFLSREQLKILEQKVNNAINVKKL